MVVSTFSLCFTSMCSLKCTSFSLYKVDFGLDQHSRKGKGFSNVTLLWDGRLDAAVSITILLYVVSFSESRHFVCKCELFKCCNLIQRA